MITENIFDPSIMYYADCLRLYFITLLQNDLDEMKLCGTITISHVNQTLNLLVEDQISFITLLFSLGVPNGVKSVGANPL